MVKTRVIAEYNTNDPRPLPRRDFRAGRCYGGSGIIFVSISATRLQAKAGKVRTLSITSAKWSMVVLDVPMFNQAGLPGYDVAGRIVAARSPLRFGDAPLISLVPSAELGAHNREVYCDWLGLSQDEVERLQKDEVI